MRHSIFLGSLLENTALQKWESTDSLMCQKYGNYYIELLKPEIAIETTHFSLGMI